MNSGQMGQLNTELKGIGQLIKDKHSVPKNQREYAWEGKHVEDFINDITEAQSENKPEYFLGTIVLTSTSSRPEVVDGQQRMATACIVIAAARDYLIRTKDADNVKSGTLLSNKFLLFQDPKDLETYPFFELNEIDNLYFRNFIIEEPENKNSSYFRKEVPSHDRLKKAYDIAYTAITKIAEAPPNKARHQLNDFISYLENNVKIISLKAPDEASAFTLFETLNDRGLDLAISDLLKNFLLGKSGDKIEDVKNRWMAMKTTLESSDAGDSIVMYIRHLWCSEYGLVREKELYNVIKKSITNSSKALSFAEKLSSNAKQYVALLQPDQEYWKEYDFNAHKYIRSLNLLNFTQPRSLLLAVMNKFKPKEAAKAVKLVEAWSFRFSVVKGLGGAAMEGFYADLAKQVTDEKIKNAAQLSNAAKAVVPTDKDFIDAMSRYRVTKAVLARYILLEIEKTHAGVEKLDYVPNDNPSDVNLEHVLPKTHDKKNGIILVKKIIRPISPS